MYNFINVGLHKIIVIYRLNIVSNAMNFTSRGGFIYIT